VTFAVHAAPLREIEPMTLYAIMALRVDVFVVEQKCPYRELDGRDLEPSAELIWADREGQVIATLRLLGEADGTARIGRVATAAKARGAGAAAVLMRHALDSATGRDVVLDAQLPLLGWYERFGFVRAGDDFDEDGIAHVPMRRAASNGG
jgi:ElaA protein